MILPNSVSSDFDWGIPHHIRPSDPRKQKPLEGRPKSNKTARNIWQSNEASDSKTGKQQYIMTDSAGIVKMYYGNRRRKYIILEPKGAQVHQKMNIVQACSLILSLRAQCTQRTRRPWIRLIELKTKNPGINMFVCHRAAERLLWDFQTHPVSILVSGSLFS